LLNVCETYDCDILSVNCAAFLADHFDALIEEDKVCIIPTYFIRGAKRII